MKILHIITNTELGGAQNVCVALANAASADGNELAVASMAGGYLWEQLDKRVIQFYVKNMVKAINPLADIKCLFELRKLIKKFNPDIIHLHSSKAGVLGRLATKKYQKKIIYTIHGFDSVRLKHRIFLSLERILQKACAFIVPVSEYDKNNLRKEKIIHNVYTIHNGVAISNIHNECPFDRKAYKKTIMTIARISKQKRFDMFLEIAARAEMREYLFVWIGASAKKSIKEIKTAYEVPANVILLGDYPNASSLIKYCDLFVLFSNYEGLPISVIEAMANEKAIVASDVGALSELLDSSNGALVKNTDDAISAIQKILSDNVLLQSMEKASLQKYKDFFTLEKMWEKYKRLYKSLSK